MSEKIKELIDTIEQKYKDYYVQDVVSGEDLKLLVDYIEKIEKFFESDMEIRRGLIDRINRQDQEIMELKATIALYDNNDQYLNDKIDKAIEYINSDEMLKLREEFEYCNDKDLFDDFVGRLDRILRRSNKK